MAGGIIGGSMAGGKRGRRRRRAPVMSGINVTPLVDVMLVLLIIFMVSAPQLTVGVPIDLPQSSANPLNQDREPLTISVNNKGEIYLQETRVQLDEIVTTAISWISVKPSRAVRSISATSPSQHCARPRRRLSHARTRVSSKSSSSGARGFSSVITA